MKNLTNLEVEKQNFTGMFDARHWMWYRQFVEKFVLDFRKFRLAN